MQPGVGLIGKKLGMTQLFRGDGRPVPVTVLEAGPCPVVMERTVERDGYRAVQVEFRSQKKEFHLAQEEQAASGTVLTVEMFKPGDRVDVSGRSIGKGFSGGMKRWHWQGGKQTHGSMSHRRPGSIGSSTTPGRVFKGHHLPGHLGNRRVTTQALEVIRVDAAHNLLMVKGAVPGSDRAIVEIRRSRKGPKVVHAPQRKKKATAVPQGPKAAAKPAAAKPAAAAAKPVAKK